MNYSYLQGKTQSPTVFYILGSLSVFTVIHSYVKPLEIPENCGYVVQAFPGECSGRGRLPGKIVFVNPKNAWSKMSVKSDENSKSLRHNGYILSTNANPHN